MTDLALRDLTDQATVGVAEKSRLRRLRDTRELGILLAAVGLFVGLSIMRPDTFLTTSNVIGVAQRISLLTIIAVGMTFVMIAGEIDLSVGSMYGLLAIGVSQAMISWGWDPAIA